MKRIIVLLFAVAFLVACSVSGKFGRSASLPGREGANWELIDSILNKGLSEEALFTLLGPVKPMSSLVTFRLPLVRTDTVDPEREAAYAKRIRDLEELTVSLNAIDLPDLRFILIPYKNASQSSRLLQVSVVRLSVLDSLLAAREDFFGRFGFVRGTAPEVVVNSIEFSDQKERWRAYGHLFGYPDYAVDFFVDAGIHHDETGEFVKRDFFQIPTYSRSDGHFVYAIPKGHRPSREVDSALYYRAKHVLDSYKAVRPKYARPDNPDKVDAYRLLRTCLGSRKIVKKRP